jgi:hypothetical protein
MHSKTTGHVSGYFEDALNEWAAKGYSFVQAVRIDDLRFTLIFERMDG